MFLIRQIVFHWVGPLKCGYRVATNQGLGDQRRSVCVQETLSKREKSCRSFCWRRQIGSSSLSFYNWFVFLASIYNPARYVILCLLFFFLAPHFLFVSFTCSFSFETIRLALCDLYFSHGLWLCGTSGWWWCLWFMNGASTEGR